MSSIEQPLAAASFALMLALTCPAGAQFIVLDFPAGAERTDAYAISADGSAVVGQVIHQGNPSIQEPARWRGGDPVDLLGWLTAGPTAPGAAYAVSADGSVVVGGVVSDDATCAPLVEAFSWSPGTGMAGLGFAPDGCRSWGYYISDDGSVIAGGVIYCCTYVPTMRVDGGPWQGLPHAGGPSDPVYVIGGSPNGNYLVGGVIETVHTGVPAFVYDRTAQSVTFIQDLPGGDSLIVAWDVSNDGSRVVGDSISGSSSLEAFLWTPKQGTMGLGDFSSPVAFSRALAVDPDGPLIVGFGTLNGVRTAAIWEADLQIQPLQNWLAARGVSVPGGWTLRVARDIRRVGNEILICGTARDPSGLQKAFLARAPASLIPVGEEHFYSVDRANDELVIIDTAKGTVHPVGPVGEDLEDVDLTMRDGELLGLARESGLNRNNRLLSFSPASGAVLDSLFIDDASSIEGLGADVAGQLFIGYDPGAIGDDVLAELGDAGGITTISDQLMYDIDGLGIAPDGRVYVVDAFGGSNVSEIVLPGGVVSLANLAIEAQDVEATATSLWALAPDGQLVQLDRLSGATSAAVQLDSLGRELYGIALVDTATTTVIDGDVTQRDLNGITVIEGDMVIIEMPDAPCLSFENLMEVTGSISAYQIPENFCLEMPQGSVSDDIIIDGTDGGVDLSIGGDSTDVIIDGTDGGVDLSIGGNSTDVVIDGSDGGVDLSIGGGSGDIYVDGGGSVDVEVGGNVDGDIEVTNSRDGGAASTGPEGTVSLTLSGSTVTGSITITAGKPTTIMSLAPLSVGGDLSADHLVQSPLDLSMIAVAGTTSIRADASNPIMAQVASLQTRIVADHGADLADVYLNTGAAAAGELITLDRLGAASCRRSWASRRLVSSPGSARLPCTRST